jgi:hypothetical protein
LLDRILSKQNFLQTDRRDRIFAKAVRAVFLLQEPPIELQHLFNGQVSIHKKSLLKEQVPNSTLVNSELMMNKACSYLIQSTFNSAIIYARSCPFGTINE